LLVQPPLSPLRRFRYVLMQSASQWLIRDMLLVFEQDKAKAMALQMIALGIDPRGTVTGRFANTKPEFQFIKRPHAQG
jgi:hypothetical protein